MNKLTDILDSIDKPIQLPLKFRTFKENEEIRLRLIHEPIHQPRPNRAPRECSICRDYPELTHKVRQVPVFTPSQDPERDAPAFMLTAKDTSPFYNATYLIMKGF